MASELSKAWENTIKTVTSPTEPVSLGIAGSERQGV